MAALDWSGREPLLRQAEQIGWAERDGGDTRVIWLLDIDGRRLGHVLLAPDGLRYRPEAGQEEAFARVAGIARWRGLLRPVVD